MPNAHAGSIKGLSIATIILSALGVIGAILIFVFSGVFSAIIAESGPDIMYDMGYGHGGSGMHHDGFGYGYDYDYDDAFVVSAIAMLFGGGLSIWMLICNVVTLVAGVLGVLNASNPPKLGLVMGWSIAGAIVGFLGGGFVTVILLIVTAVFANSDKRAYLRGSGFQQPPQPPVA